MLLIFPLFDLDKPDYVSHFHWQNNISEWKMFHLLTTLQVGLSLSNCVICFFICSAFSCCFKTVDQSFTTSSPCTYLGLRSVGEYTDTTTDTKIEHNLTPNTLLQIAWRRPWNFSYHQANFVKYFSERCFLDVCHLTEKVESYRVESPDKFIKSRFSYRSRLPAVIFVTGLFSRQSILLF